MKKYLLNLFLLLPGLARAEQGPVIPVLRIVDSINVGSTEYFLRNLREAEERKVPALILLLDTPGGLLESTREIVQALLKTPVKVVVWVTPEGARAASAGAMITLAAHVATMSRSTSIGAASPVSIGGGGEDKTSELSETMKSKITNDTVAFVEGIAQARGRSLVWAKKFVSEASSLTSDVALREGVIDALVSSQAEVWKAALKKYPELPREVDFEVISFNLKEQVLSFVSNPNVAYGLLALGTLGLYVEMSHPGLVVPGTIGAVSLALGAISLKILPIKPGAVVLLLVALVLLGVEFLTALPTYGVAGTLGIASLFFSGVFLMDKTQTNLGLAPEIWLPAFVLVSVFSVFLGMQSLRALRAKPFRQGAHALLGETAEVTRVNDSGQEGWIKVHGGELWKATLVEFPESSLRVGDQVKVVEQKSMRVFVTKKGS